jgi:hypothetical protein
MPAPTPTPEPTPAPTQEPTPSPTATPAAMTTASPRPSAAATRKPGGSPEPTPIDLSPYLTAELAFVSMWDGSVDLVVEYVDEKGKASEVLRRTFVQYDSMRQQVMPLVYRVSITRKVAGAKAITCKVQVKDGQRYQLVVLAEVVAITREGFAAKEADDLILGTSPLCTK